MNRRDIQELRVHVGQPAITLVMKCNKEKIRKQFVTLLRQIKSKAALLASLEGQFDVMFDQLVCPIDGGTVAIFVNKYIARFYFLPCEMEEIVTCGQTFKLDAIVAELNRLKRYWMIDCTANRMKLFEGVKEHVIEVEKARVELDSTNNPFKRNPQNVDTYLGDYLDQDHLPICLVGSVEDVKDFRENSSFRGRVVANVSTITDVWPALQKYFEQEQKEVLQELHSGVEGTTYVVGLQNILKAARQGAVSKLLVEEGYRLDACEEQVTRQVITKKPMCPVGYQKISLIDQIIESVRAKGGYVLLVPDGILNKYERLVALIRFF